MSNSIKTVQEALLWGRNIVHASHYGSVGTCTWPFCMKVAELLDQEKGEAMKPALTQGDVVFLNSGSPELTVENVTGQFAKVIWFDGNQVESGTFDVACLTLKQ